MLPSWVKRLGPTKFLIILTMLAVLISVGISWVLNVALRAEFTLVGLSISVTAPLVITPLIGFFFVRVLFELDAARAQLKLLAEIDDLTQVYNRRFFMKRAEYELARARRYGQVFSMLLFDLDDFKQINDEFGHPAGDALLRMVANVANEESREVDVLARLGGDEFGFLIPGLDQDEALSFADRMRETIAASCVVYRSEEICTTISVGVITWDTSINDLETLIFLMDQALYEAKHGGKDRTVLSKFGANAQGEFSAFLE